MKHEWEKGMVFDTRPSFGNWLLWAVLLFGVVFLIVYMISAEDIEFLIRFTEENWGVILSGTGGIGLFLFLRGRVMLNRILSATEYLFFVFPKLRKSLPSFSPYSRVAIIYTGYEKSDVEIHNAIASAFKAAFHYGAERTIFVFAMSVGEKGEKELAAIESLRREMIMMADSEGESLYYEHNLSLKGFIQDGSGKRNALADAITAVREDGGAHIYYMMDGDSCPEQQAFSKAIPYFQQYENLGGATLGNRAYVQGGGGYNMYSQFRFVRRHMDLAYAPTVLTGRGSFIRGEILESDRTLDLLRSHFIEWSEDNTILALTGDDKTMVFATWEKGFETMYIPDALVYAMEEPIPFKLPKNRLMKRFIVFFRIDRLLRPLTSFYGQETRYSRNMLLIGKALRKVCHKSVNPNITMKLYDQGYFFWSGLVGPFFGVMAGFVFNPVMFKLWLLGTITLRTFLTLIQGFMYGYWHPAMVFYSFLNIPQSIVKIIAFCNIGVAKWSRGGQEIEVARSTIRPIAIITLIASAIFSLVAIS